MKKREFNKLTIKLRERSLCQTKNQVPKIIIHKIKHLNKRPNNPLKLSKKQEIEKLMNKWPKVKKQDIKVSMTAKQILIRLQKIKLIKKNRRK